MKVTIKLEDLTELKNDLDHYKSETEQYESITTRLKDEVNEWIKTFNRQNAQINELRGDVIYFQRLLKTAKKKGKK